MFNYEQSLYVLYLIEINKQISHVYFYYSLQHVVLEHNILTKSTL